MFFINPFIFAGGGDFESIATVTVGSGGASSITFSALPSGFQHLQIRMITSGARSDGNAGPWLVNVEPNGDTGTNAAYHDLFGNGATASAGGYTSQKVAIGIVNGYSADSTTMCATVVDILDYGSTTKNKTFRTLSGADRNGAGHIWMQSSVWLNTNAITSLKIVPDSGLTGFRRWTTAALYGIR